MKCLLVSTNRATVPYPVYPLGTAHLAGALEQAGHPARLYDVLSNDGVSGLPAAIREFEPDLVGVSVRNIDNVDSSDYACFLTDAIEAVAVIRENTSVPLVIGGPAVSLFPEKLMDMLGADYAVVGQGERILVEIADAIDAGSPVPHGILRADLKNSEWYPVKYDAHAAEFYLSSGGMLNVQTKRGCPYRCTYCSYPLIEGRRVRCREPDEVAEDVMELVRRHGARYIFFTDAVFNDSSGHFLEVAEALIRAGNTTPWCAFFRPQGIDADILRLLRRSGLAGMEIGTDGTTDETLEGFGKGFTFESVEQCSRAAAKLHIPCAHFCMFGGPGESEITLKQGIKNLERLSGAVVFAFAGIRILPGTSIYETAAAQGIIKEGEPLLEPVFYFSPGMNFEKIDSELRTSWHNRIDRVYPCSALYEQIRRLHQRGYTGPLWDILIRK